MKPRLAPIIPVNVVKAPILRVLRAGPVPAASRRLRLAGRTSLDSFFVRVLGGTLLASVPTGALILILIFVQAAQTNTDAALSRTEVVARGASAQIGGWLVERQAQLRALARDAQDSVGSSTLATRVHDELATSGAFAAIGIVDIKGNVVSLAGPDTAFLAVGSSPWFARSLEVETIQPIRKKNGALEWIATSPIAGSDRKSQGLVIANLNVSRLGTLLQPFSGSASSSEVHIAGSDHLLIYSSDWYLLNENASILGKGALSIEAEGGLVDQALGKGPGSIRAVDYRHHDVLAGFYPIHSLGWVVVASTDAAAALAPVYNLERLTVVIALIGTVLLIGLAILLTAQTVKPIRVLSQLAGRVEAGDLSGRFHPSGGVEIRVLGDTFNAMLDRLSGVLFELRGEVTESAVKLSAAAERLVSATQEQTAAATATSASMDELGRSSVSIAGDMDRVAGQAGAVRTSIELAQADLRVSGDRAESLAHQVGEIDRILAHINDVADQTNLLALNAAIEAARAGDAGRGFAVVADEVRRLAERSKASSSEITKLVRGTQLESAETIRALKKRALQMQEWLGMMQTMTDVSGQVQLAAQRQRSATEQVVHAIDQIAEGSRSVAATAQEIASAAARQGVLAGDLSGSGWETSERAKSGS